MFDRVEIDEYACNWKTFIEVYLEDYHVGPFHPGLGNFVTFADLVGVRRLVQRPDLRGEPGSRSPARQSTSAGTRRCCDFYEGERPPHGAIWLTYFPNIMVEWYPHALVVSTLVPAGAGSMHERRRVLLSRRHRSVRARVRGSGTGRVQETAVEDAEIIERMTPAGGADQQGTSESDPISRRWKTG